MPDQETTRRSAISAAVNGRSTDRNWWDWYSLTTPNPGRKYPTKPLRSAPSTRRALGTFSARAVAPRLRPGRRTRHVVGDAVQTTRVKTTRAHEKGEHNVGVASRPGGGNGPLVPAAGRDTPAARSAQ